MSAESELTADIRSAPCEDFRQSGRDMRATAAHLIAEGWTKPRVVTTAAELELAVIACFEEGEALSLRDAGFRHWIVWEDDYGLWHYVSAPYEDDPEKLTAECIALPATVLHEPGEGQ